MLKHPTSNDVFLVLQHELDDLVGRKNPELFSSCIVPTEIIKFRTAGSSHATPPAVMLRKTRLDPAQYGIQLNSLHHLGETWTIAAGSAIHAPLA